MTNDAEALRQSYKPDNVRVLLVGESAPAGGRFFYRADSQAYHAIAAAFGKQAGAGFLGWFKDQGYYLDDLVGEPIDKAGRELRRSARRDSIPGLTYRIRAYRPRLVVAIAKCIAAEVEEAVKQSATGAMFRSTCFPGNGHQARFRLQISGILRDFAAAGHGPSESTASAGFPTSDARGTA